jgi:hypothetical protein
MSDTFAWIGDGLGSDQIGRSVEIEGKKGVVVEGTGLTITVRWNELSPVRRQRWEAIRSWLVWSVFRPRRFPFRLFGRKTCERGVID